MSWFGKTESGSVSSIIEKQQKEHFKEWKEEREYQEKRKKKLRKLKEQREEAKAKGRRRRVAILGLKIKKKAQVSKLNRKRRIGII